MTNKCRRKRDNIELRVQYFSDCRGDLASGPFLSRLLLCFGDLSPWLGPPPPNRGSSILPAFGIAVRIPCYKTLRLNLRVFFKIFRCIFFNHSFFLSGVSHIIEDEGSYFMKIVMMMMIGDNVATLQAVFRKKVPSNFSQTPPTQSCKDFDHSTNQRNFYRIQF